MCSILPQASDISIDNTDSTLITYRPAEEWKRFVGEMFKSSSQHNTQTGGASFTVKFNGSYVWYASDMNFDHGRFQVELDGNVSTGTSYNTSYQAEEYLFCQELDETQEHTLTVSNLDDGKYFTIDYITYRPVAPSSSSSSSESLPSSATSPATMTSDPTSLPAQSAATGSRGVNPGIYAGIILFAVALVLLGLLFFFVRRDRRRRAQRLQAMPPPPETVESGHWMQWQWPPRSSQSSLVSWHEPRRGSS